MLDSALLFGVWFIIAATVIPLLRHGDWWIRAFEFPRAQIAYLGVALGIAGWFRLDRNDPVIFYSLLVLAGCLAWQAFRIARYTPLFPTQMVKRPQAFEHGDSLRLISANVYQFNRRADALLELVAERKPDLLLLLETDDWWAGQLEGLHSEYPYRLQQAQDDTYGLLLFSRLELIDAEVRFIRREHVPSVRVWLRLPSGRRVRFYGLHPEPPYPVYADTSRQRDAELLTIAEEISDEPDEPTIVMGDLNDVAWSRTTRLFQRMSGLLDPRIGRFPMNTFPAHLPLLRFPLDHVFLSEHFALAAFERLPDIHSDHFPVLCEVRLDRLAEEEQDPPAPENGDEEEVDEVFEEANGELEEETAES